MASSSIKQGRRRLLREEARDDGRHRGMGSILAEEPATKTISLPIRTIAVERIRQPVSPRPRCRHEP